VALEPEQDMALGLALDMVEELAQVQVDQLVSAQALVEDMVLGLEPVFESVLVLDVAVVRERGMAVVLAQEQALAVALGLAQGTELFVVDMVAGMVVDMASKVHMDYRRLILRMGRILQMANHLDQQMASHRMDLIRRRVLNRMVHNLLSLILQSLLIRMVHSLIDLPMVQMLISLH